MVADSPEARSADERDREDEDRDRGRERDRLRDREERERERDREKVRERDKEKDREREREERDRNRDDRASLKRERMDGGVDSDDNRTESKRTNLGSKGDVSKVQSSLRFLVPNTAAGSVIGKGGAVISEFQTQSGAKIVLSRAREFFPGTFDRIVLLNGTVNAILTALHLILSKLADDDTSQKDSPDRDSRRVMDLRIIVPNRVCGALIGRGGATIRSFGDDSGATLKLSSQDNSQGAVGERMITVSGSVEQQLRAVALILAKVSEDPSYLQYADVPLSYTAASGGAPAAPPPRGPPASMPYAASVPPALPAYRGGGRYREASPPVLMAQPQLHGSTTIIVAVPDEHVGAVVGKGGRVLHEIQQHSGARIHVSDRGDFVEGTTSRKLTLTGSADAVVSAQHLIAQKVQSSITMAEEDRRRALNSSSDRGGAYARGVGDQRSGNGRDRDYERRGPADNERRDYDRGGRGREDKDGESDRRDRERGRGRDAPVEDKDRDRDRGERRHPRDRGDEW